MDGGCVGNETVLSSLIVSRSLVASGGDALVCFDSRLGILSGGTALGVFDGNGGGAALGMFNGNGSADAGTALGSFSGDGDFGSEMQ